MKDLAGYSHPLGKPWRRLSPFISQISPITANLPGLHKIDYNCSRCTNSCGVILMPFDQPCVTTLIGSFPHINSAALCSHLARAIQIPAWPQLPRRTFRENMYTQYSAGLPGIMVDDAHQKVYFNTADDLSPALEEFYGRYLADDVDSFALPIDYAAGFYTMLDTLKSASGEWAKGHVTGPISFGLTVLDQDLRSSLYNEQLVDPIVKQLAFNARWQIRQLKQVRPNAIIFVDEPYMASFGSAFISLSREQVVTLLNEVFDAIHAEGALAGVHCCGNTDWSVLMATSVDILNLDAYGYLENLALYPGEVRAFLDRGGNLAWGIIPNNEHIFAETPESLAQRLRTGLQLIGDKARGRGISIGVEEFADRSLITTACGLGPTSIEIADRAIETLAQAGEILQRG
jgi:methionine synthase II (cobalamin-independent)